MSQGDVEGRGQILKTDRIFFSRDGDLQLCLQGTVNVDGKPLQGNADSWGDVEGRLFNE